MSSENKPDWKILSSQIQQFYQFFSKLTPSQLSQIKLKQEIVQEFKKFMDKLLQYILPLNFAQVSSNSELIALVPDILEKALCVNDILLDQTACKLVIKLMYALTKLRVDVKPQTAVQQNLQNELWKKFSTAIQSRIAGLPFLDSKEMQPLLSSQLQPADIFAAAVADYSRTLCEELSLLEQIASHYNPTVDDTNRISKMMKELSDTMSDLLCDENTHYISQNLSVARHILSSDLLHKIRHYSPMQELSNKLPQDNVGLWSQTMPTESLEKKFPPSKIAEMSISMQTRFYLQYPLRFYQQIVSLMEDVITQSLFKELRDEEFYRKYIPVDVFVESPILFQAFNSIMKSWIINTQNASLLAIVHSIHEIFLRLWQQNSAFSLFTYYPPQCKEFVTILKTTPTIPLYRLLNTLRKSFFDDTQRSLSLERNELSKSDLCNLIEEALYSAAFEV